MVYRQMLARALRTDPGCSAQAKCPLLAGLWLLSIGQPRPGLRFEFGLDLILTGLAALR